MKRQGSLLFRFAVIFAVFICVALLLGAASAYMHQRNSYHRQCEKRLVDIADHLKSLVESDRRVFFDFQEYLIKHREDILIDAKTLTDWHSSWYVFDAMFRTVYPQKTLGIDISFNQMREDVQHACAIYFFKKWSTVFIDAARNFGIHSVSYLVPSMFDRTVYDILSSSRQVQQDDPELLAICPEESRPSDRYRTFWQSWTDRGRAAGHDTHEGKSGQAYAYYATVMLDGQRIGVIETEVSTAEADHIIFEEALRQTIGVGVVLLITTLCVLLYLNERFILRLKRLQESVRSYSLTKDPEIAVQIAKQTDSQDEISLLSRQISAMIHEIQNYIQSLTKTTADLAEERENADVLRRLVNCDALTGLRNQHAYELDMSRLDAEIGEGRADFALVVIDLNFLKKINDQYGHECGNDALKKLCVYIRSFFSDFRIYRIGGDEFVVLIEHEEKEQITNLVTQFREFMEDVWNNASLENWERISAAAGYACYDQATDKTTCLVFKRADADMYKHKLLMKASRSQ